MMDSDSSDGEEFEGFVLTPEEKASYKFWARKRGSASEAMGSETDEDMSGDDDDDGEEFGIEEEDKIEEIEDLDDQVDDINMEESAVEMSPGNIDQCPVCLMSLKEQLLGTPNNCPHVFCFDCIQEWAKNATTCPVGRQPFNEILVHATKKGPILQRIQVEQQPAEDDEEEDDPTYCEVCGECNREDRMLLCDGCDSGYHMECLTPPVEFVPLDEWYCPVCVSHEDGQEEEEEREEYEEPAFIDSEVRRVLETPLARTTRGRPRGRPRGSTARRLSISGRTATVAPRAARTVASTRGRSTTRRGRGNSRGQGRGRSRSSTRGRSSSTKKTSGKKRKQPKAVSRSTKKKSQPGKTKRYCKRKRKCKSKTTRKRHIAEEDEVSPFIYEPKRRGKTVHARLLESLNSTGRSTETRRSSSSSSSSSMARIPFPSRVEPSCSFSLFGNAYALHDFDEGGDDPKLTQKEEQAATPWTSSQSSNPDVLGSIFEGLNTLHSSSAQVSRDGKLVGTADQSRDGPALGSQTKRTICKEKKKGDSDVHKTKEETKEEKKALKESINVSEFHHDNSTHPTQSHRRSQVGEELSQSISFSKPRLNASCSDTKEMPHLQHIPSASVSGSSFFKQGYSASCSKPKQTPRPQYTSSPSVSSSPSTIPKSLLSTPSLSGFRIPKRRLSCDSQNEPSKVMATFSEAGIVRQEVASSSPLSTFKIPKRVKNALSEDHLPGESCGDKEPTRVRHCVAQSLACGSEQKRLSSNPASLEKNAHHYSCTTDSRTLQSSPSCSYIVTTRESIELKNVQYSKSPVSEIIVSNSTSVTRSHANIASATEKCSAAASASSARPSVHRSGDARPAVKRLSIEASCHATTLASCSSTETASTSTVPSPELTSNNTCVIKRPKGVFHRSAASSSSVTPLTRVAPSIDKSKSIAGKERRLSNIEIIKLLQERQQRMRQQMVKDPIVTDSSSSSSETDLKSPSRERFFKSSSSPSCPRPVNLPVAVVKPSPQTSCTVVTTQILVSPTGSDMSPVKSIASGIIDVHSSSTQELKRVRKESSSGDSKDKAREEKQHPKSAGVNGDRQQQRRMGIARLQRQQQIVDEVKLALKPFFKRGEVSRDDYKLIMRKSVEKIKESSSSVDRDRVIRLVKKYVKKFKAVNSTAPP